MPVDYQTIYLYIIIQYDNLRDALHHLWFAGGEEQQRI